MLRRPPRSTLFPYTTSSDLRRGSDAGGDEVTEQPPAAERPRPVQLRVVVDAGGDLDRKSTRLNSSHVEISYAVFCLKKKTQLTEHPHHPPLSSVRRYVHLIT